MMSCANCDCDRDWDRESRQNGASLAFWLTTFNRSQLFCIFNHFVWEPPATFFCWALKWRSSPAATNAFHSPQEWQPLKCVTIFGPSSRSNYYKKKKKIEKTEERKEASPRRTRTTPKRPWHHRWKRHKWTFQDIIMGCVSQTVLLPIALLIKCNYTFLSKSNISSRWFFGGFSTKVSGIEEF